MKPRLRPNEGWNWRVIVCDKEGNYEYDDVMFLEQVMYCADVLAKKVAWKQKRK